MKTFKDLVFVDKSSFMVDKIQAILELDNGYGISVVQGSMFYCSEYTYEVAILKDGDLCYDTPLTADVLCYQTPEDIDNILAQLESL